MSDNLDFILRARKAKQATDKAMAGIRNRLQRTTPPKPSVTGSRMESSFFRAAWA